LITKKKEVDECINNDMTLKGSLNDIIKRKGKNQKEYIRIERKKKKKDK